jgi:signal transduction histidine kinase
VRLDTARTHQGTGAGLGLAIVREIVAAHGGSVWVEDAQPGARFIVRLPVQGTTA